MEKHRKKIGWTFSFARMHPALQLIVGTVAGIATVGYLLAGTWLAYILLTR